MTEDNSAKAQFGRMLQELKTGFDAKLSDFRQQLETAKHTPVSETAPITPDAVRGLAALMKSLPRVIGDSLSGDAARVGAARNTMEALRQRLNATGLDADERLTNVPDRFAQLREDFANRRAAKQTEENQAPNQNH